jgi:hypothetical protein
MKERLRKIIVDRIKPVIRCEQSENLDDWLTVHRSITFFDLQLDAQILIYLHIIHLLSFKNRASYI